MCFPGTQTALSLVMLGLAEEGDEIITGDPLYATYDGVVRATGATACPCRFVRKRAFACRRRTLRRSSRRKPGCFCSNTPHNPTGAVLSDQEIAEIGEVCRRHNLWIVSDEVYELLIFNGTFASPLDRPELADRTIAVASISKSHAAPGFRSGWCIGPKEFTRRLLPLSEIHAVWRAALYRRHDGLCVGPALGRGRNDARELPGRAQRISERLDGIAGIICQGTASRHVHTC